MQFNYYRQAAKLKSFKFSCEDWTLGSLGQTDYFIADKGYDPEAARDKYLMHEMTPIIPKRANAKQSNSEFDSYLYKLTSSVESMFARLKHFCSWCTQHTSR